MDKLKNMETTHGKITQDSNTNEKFEKDKEKHEKIFEILHSQRTPKESVAKREYLASLENKSLEELQTIGMKQGAFPFSTRRAMLDAIAKLYQRNESDKDKDKEFQKTINMPRGGDEQKDIALQRALAGR